MSNYLETVEGKLGAIADRFWKAGRENDMSSFSFALIELQQLRLLATQRSEFAKAAMQGLATQPGMDYTELAQQAFWIADAMLAEEAKKR